MSPQTPDEVWLHIARELIRWGDLASLSRSSRRFLSIARSVLYQTVSLSLITTGGFDPHSGYVSDTLALLARDASLAQCTTEVSLDEFPIRGQGITQSNLRRRSIIRVAYNLRLHSRNCQHFMAS
ncbi:hypothetical protein C8J56DRAFT_1052615 [Mycena floridula]|nr:hypothetical protein C8J56DRAFT_1070711 [Mycena floridula]KAJ7586246.1 hypothetical protein C8J56DRAFT_1052615 [Mycena floridula]